jgi:hypothetical protein
LRDGLVIPVDKNADLPEIESQIFERIHQFDRIGKTLDTFIAEVVFA